MVLATINIGSAIIPAALAQEPTTSETLFQNVSRQAGIASTRISNDRAIGQAWGDFDRDGWVDFYVTDTRGPNTLFRNNGDGTFAVPPQAAAVARPNDYSGGASFADYDNDGWLDLYLVNWGENRLFRNENGEHFVDVTETAGVGDDANGQTASWGDFDNDGWLDLYVANWACYPRCGRPSEGDRDRLYRNNGDGTFSDVSRYLGGSTNGAGFVASFTDFDNDGDQDIYLVNDEFLFPIGNKLWRNDGPGCEGHCFTEISESAGANTQVMGMGLTTADYDNDGDFDFYFSNAGPMTLLQNRGDGTFVDVAGPAGVARPRDIAWGNVSLDYNNDGWLDLYLAVMTTVGHQEIPANPLFHNNGDGTFKRISSGSGASDVGPTMGVATADYDRDGWVDLLLGNKDNGYALLRNQTSARTNANWLALDLIGAGPVNRDAVGSRVQVEAAGQLQVREVRNGASLGAGNELTLYFGLGNATQVAQLQIRWPDGHEQAFANVEANTRYQLSYPLAGPTDLLVSRPDGSTPTRRVGINPTGSTLPLTLTAILLLAIVVYFGRQAAPLTWSWGWLRGATLLAGLAISLLAIFWASRHNVSALQPDTARLDRLLAEAGATLPVLMPSENEAQIALGEALFWDPILSGNKDISCATCHHPSLGTGDALAVSIGTGGLGLGQERSPGRKLVPRNASPIYNLAAVGFDVLFWDGRVSGSPLAEYDSPANDDLPFGLENVVAVQAMFPVTSRDEMRGHRGDFDINGERNELASINDHQTDQIWEALMARLMAIPGYLTMFADAYPNVDPAAYGFEHAAAAMAAYQMERFTFLNSPFDNYLAGDREALAGEQLAGAILFYGEAGCAACHSGPLLTDLAFYNIGVPQIGPGKGFEEPFDFGRARETGDEADRFAFRTPPLRNVAVTGPWMHNGAFSTLAGVIRHHLDPAASLATYDLNQLSPLVLANTDSNPETWQAPVHAESFYALDGDLTDEEIAQLIAFLNALTANRLITIPTAVPSGLPVSGQ